MAEGDATGQAGGDAAAGLLAKVTRLLSRGLARNGAAGDDEADKPLGDAVVADDADSVASLLGGAQVVEASRDWPADRIEILEALWGEGFVTPLDGAALAGLCAPLELDSNNSLLLLGAGLGGAARTLAADTGVWVTGMELSEELADLAMKRSIDAGLTKKAPVSPVDPDSLEIRPRSFHHVLAEDFLYMVKDKKRLLEQLGIGLKPGGRLVLIDLVRGAAAAEEAFRLWRGVEGGDADPASGRDLRAALTEAGFAIEEETDFGERYRRAVLTGWLRFVSTLEKGKVERRRATYILRECEYWLRRLAALDEGSLRVVCVMAVKQDDGGAGK